MSDLTEFYRQKKLDITGRNFSDMIDFNDAELEETHDYIQWLFPLPEVSQFNQDAPVLSQQDIEEFKTDPVLKQNLDRSYKTMISFYGFEEDEKTKRVSRSPDFKKSAENWLTPANHNFLRISRILRCLSLVGAEDKSKQFFDALKSVYAENPSVIGEKTFSFWKAGAESAPLQPQKPNISLPKLKP